MNTYRTFIYRATMLQSDNCCVTSITIHTIYYLIIIEIDQRLQRKFD